MRVILALALALSVLAGVGSAAYAVDDNPRDYWERQKQNLP